MKIQPDSVRDEIDFDILEETKRTPGITALGLGRRVHRSRYAVLDRTENLEKQQYLTRILSRKNTYLMYPSPTLTFEDIQEAKVSFEKNMVESLKNNQGQTPIEQYINIIKYLVKKASKSFRTLIALAEQGESTCQQLVDFIKPKVTSQTIDNQFQYLIEKGLVERKRIDLRTYVYYLASPLTYELLEECLREIKKQTNNKISVSITLNSKKQSNQLASSIDNGKVTVMTENNQPSTSALSQVDNSSTDELSTDEEVLLLLDIVEQQKEEIGKLRLEMETLKQRLKAVEQKQTSVDTTRVAKDQIRQRLDAMLNGHR